MTKIAYSYIRFSTKKQVTDSSVAVQLERVRKYAEENGYELSEQSYSDLGVSALHNKNVKEGALGAFLQAVQDGYIAADATLIIENLDRISRANPWDALPVFMNIINSGVTIVTLADKQVYTRKDTTSSNGMMAIFGSLMVLVRAHEESATKSDRAKKGIRKRLSDGLKVGKAPFWLKTTKDKKDFEIIKAKANIVREAFTLRRDGMGSQRIATHLNENYGFRWGSPQVVRLLMNPAVIGTKMSQVGAAPVLGYYRPILDPTLYYEVQTLLNKPGAKARGRKPVDVPNLFTSIARCALCEGSLQFFRASKTVSQQYLKCRGSLNKLCPAGFINYTAFEKEVIGWLLMDQEDEVVRVMQRGVRKINVTEAETRILVEQRQNLIELAKKGLADDDAIAAEIRTLGERIKEIQARAPEVIAVEDDRSYPEKAWALVERLEDARLGDDQSALHAVRQELKTTFAGSLDAINVFPDKRVGDVHHCKFSVRIRGEDGEWTREYTRPALNNIKGVWNGR